MPVRQQLGIGRGGAIVRGPYGTRTLGNRRLAYLQQNDKAVLVYSTFPSQDAAEKEGAKLVDAGLAACVNIIPGMVSIYVWDGKRHRDAEPVMLIKTRPELAARVVEEIRARHPYKNPALFVIRMEGGSQAFLDWIRGQTATPSMHSDTGQPATE